jgi:hypothetical protein
VHFVHSTQWVNRIPLNHWIRDYIPLQSGQSHSKTTVSQLNTVPQIHAWQQFAQTASVTCHRFQARGRHRFQLGASYAPEDWQFRRSHYGLFLPLVILFWFHSMTFDRVIIISWCSALNSLRVVRFNICLWIRLTHEVVNWFSLSVGCMYEIDIWADLLLTVIFATTTKCSWKWSYKSVCGWSFENVIVKFYLEKNIVEEQIECKSHPSRVWVTCTHSQTTPDSIIISWNSFLPDLIREQNK